MNVEPTYIFRNGKTYAMIENQIVASVAGDDVEELERKLQEDGVAADARHTHITTPNGVKGKILGRVKSLWGEEVTVRFENGRIDRIAVSGDLRFSSEHDAEPADDDLVDALKRELDQPVDEDREALETRADTLAAVKTAATKAIGKGDYARDKALNGLVVQAEFEMAELADAMRQMDSDDAEAFAPPKPYRMEVAPQNGPNIGGDSFLDDAYNEMTAEAQNTNYEQLMDEGPEAFVADLDTPALQDAGTVRSMASSYIRTRTATADPKLRDKYERVWIDRVESLRRAEVITRKEIVKKEAAAQEDVSQYPDESLFT